MGNLTTLILAIFASVMASTGFWAYVSARRAKKDLTKDMLLGLGHDRLVHLGMVYIEQGFITEEEYDNYVNWLYKPYKALNGNGTVDRIKMGVDELEIRKSWASSSKNAS